MESHVFLSQHLLVDLLAEFSFNFNAQSALAQILCARENKKICQTSKKLITV